MHSLFLEVGLGANVVDLDVVGELPQAALPDLKGKINQIKNTKCEDTEFPCIPAHFFSRLRNLSSFLLVFYPLASFGRACLN